MSNLSGLSAILTVSLVALVTIQMLKDKFDMVENYGEEHNNVWTFQNAPDTAKSVSDVYRNIPINMPINNQNLSNQKPHGEKPFGEGDFFRPPFVSPTANANGWNGFPEAYSVYQQSINAATPNMDNFRAIGAETVSLPGPNVFMNDSFAQADVNQGRADSLSLCAQNAPTGGTAPLNVASSLLPMPAKENMEGFESCETSTNLLANQVFLNHQIGVNTVSGSLKNASLDLRSEPPNSILNVGPWHLSSIYPDLTRRPLEGCGPSFGLYGNGPNSSGTPTKIFS
jgi:hypothetical protein